MFSRMLFVGLSTNDLEIIKKLILEYHVGGITLYKKNYRSYEEMLNLINYIYELANKAGYVILIGIDEEGYRVNRLPNEIHNLKSPYSFHQDINSLMKHGNLIASILSQSGIHVNFAPVLDIKRFPDNHAIGDRCFGDSADEVIKNTIPYIQEFKKLNVVPVIKHFPGHGATKINTHYMIPIIWNTKKLFNEDIMPFKCAIKSDIDIIMVGHFFIPKISFFTPLSLSKKAKSLLKDKLGYQNIIMTDDLMMGILKLWNKKSLIKKAVLSGNHIIMIKYYQNLFKDIENLQKKLKDSKQVEEAISKIEHLIIKYNISNKKVTKTLNIDKINKEIDILNEKANKSSK